MNINNAFPSKYLKASDIEHDDLILTISHVEVENMAQQGEASELKPVVYFEETEKGFVLNKTNATTIGKLYTPETDNWPGKKIAVFSTEVDFAGKQTLALRVRMKPPAGNGTASARVEHGNPPPLAYPPMPALPADAAEALRNIAANALKAIEGLPPENTVDGKSRLIDAFKAARDQAKERGLDKLIGENVVKSSSSNLSAFTAVVNLIAGCAETDAPPF